MDKLICIIPARGGSKRFPGKNLSIIGGKTLVRRSIDLAINTNIFDKILLTSDDDKILDEAKELSKIIDRHKRSNLLSNDTATIKELTYLYVNLLIQFINMFVLFCPQLHSPYQTYKRCPL